MPGTATAVPANNANAIRHRNGVRIREWVNQSSIDGMFAF
jgi:hypothetical protein